MKQLSTIIALLVLFSCTSKPVKTGKGFKSVYDSCNITYQDSTQGPFSLVALYRTSIAFRPVKNDSSTTIGEWDTDTAWAVRQQSDTSKAPNAIHVYRYTPVDKKWVHYFSPYKH